MDDTTLRPGRTDATAEDGLLPGLAKRVQPRHPQQDQTLATPGYQEVEAQVGKVIIGRNASLLRH